MPIHVIPKTIAIPTQCLHSNSKKIQVLEVPDINKEAWVVREAASGRRHSPAQTCFRLRLSRAGELDATRVTVRGKGGRKNENANSRSRKNIKRIQKVA